MTQRPETKKQRATLDAICAICAETGRAATMTEVAKRTGRAVSTIHKQVHDLIDQGLLLDARGLQPTDRRYETGWKEGVTFLGREVQRVLAEHHASIQVVRAVDEVVTSAGEVTPK